MQVDQLFIIAVYKKSGEDFEEIRIGADALYARYAKKMAPACIQLIRMRTDGVEWDEGVKVKVKKGGDLEPDETKRIGVYVYGHGYGSSTPPTLSTLPAPKVAELIHGIGFKRIDKLCLLACNLAPKEGEMGKQGSGRSFLEQLCVALQGKGLTPKMAGWNSFVTVCYTEMHESIYEKKGKKHEIQGDLVGRKAAPGVKGGLKEKKTLVTPEIRDARKMVYVWNPGGPVRLELRDWTDKRVQ